MMMKGWDVGGVNIKAARVKIENDDLHVCDVESLYFEIWREKERLKDVLRKIDEETGKCDAFGITMTAELSDIFRTKSEGVRFILSAFNESFTLPMFVVDVFGKAHPLLKAKETPLSFAAANWAATAALVARWFSDCIMVDVGSTTTDIIPIRGGKIACRGRTDTERLQTGELIFSGMLRTPPSSLVHEMFVCGKKTKVSPEYFCIMGDVYLLLDKISEKDYVCPTPDGRGKTKEFASERIARLVCADRDTLDYEEIVRMADYLAEKHVEQIEGGLKEVLSVTGPLPLVACGSGKFIIDESAARLGLAIHDISGRIGEASSVAPCVGAALLAAEACR